jgi:hypothetical protein
MGLEPDLPLDLGRRPQSESGSLNTQDFASMFMAGLGNAMQGFGFAANGGAAAAAAAAGNPIIVPIFIQA